MGYFVGFDTDPSDRISPYLDKETPQKSNKTLEPYNQGESTHPGIPMACMGNLAKQRRSVRPVKIA